MIDKRRAAALGEQADTRNAPTPAESQSSQSASDVSAANEAALEADDDFVPSSIFESSSPFQDRDATGAPPVNSLDVDDSDYLPAEIFEPVELSEGGTPTPDARESHDPEKVVESHVPSHAPALVSQDAHPKEFVDVNDSGTSDDDAVAESAASTASQASPGQHKPIGSAAPEQEPLRRPLKTEGWFKPFPVVPPLPLPLPASSTPAHSKTERPPNPKQALGATAPRLAALHTENPMIKATIRKDPPRAGTARIPSILDDLLRLAASLGASRLYLAANTPPSVRIGGGVQPLVSTVLDPGEIERLLVSLALATHGSTRTALALRQWSFELGDVASIRCITFSDVRGPGAVFRIAPIGKVAGEPIGLSLDIQTLAVERDGLVIVSGPRGSEKEAVMGALVDLVNRSRRAYVIRVQREATASSRGEGSFISQREAHGGLDDMLSVARAALQEDPDVLVLEEVNSAPLMSLSFDAAASGQLIIASFTAPSATAAVERIVDLFPFEQARQVQLSLAHHLRGVVGQVLLPKVDGGLVAARELLLNTGPVSTVLAAGKVEHLGAAIAAGHHQGMVLLSDVLVDLVQKGVVAGADAYRAAPDPVGFIDELKRLGIDTSFVKRID